MGKVTAPRAVPLVLVVDDSADNRQLYARYFSFKGMAADVATTGLEAIDKALAISPDAIVMDLAMPAMDGWRATRWLKTDRRTKRIPVIALTGHAFEGNKAKAIEAGCDLFVIKPCLPADLLKAVQGLIGRRWREGRRTSRPAISGPRRPAKRPRS